MFCRFLSFSLALLMICAWICHAAGSSVQNGADQHSPFVKVKVVPRTQLQLEFLKTFEPYQASEIPPFETDRAYYYVMPEDRVDILRSGDIDPEISALQGNVWEDQYYYSYQEVYDNFLLMTMLYPEIAVIESLGVSTRDSVTIWGLKISDNPGQQEDEPDVLFDAVTHAREPVNVEVLIVLIDDLLTDYGRDSTITHYVDETEIWVVPIKNPEGLIYVETGIPNPWWRKNKLDNNENGIFDAVEPDTCEGEYPSHVDGVDLNRNYPEGWDNAGRPYSCSIVYCGPYPHSESETLMERYLAEREHFVASICFHSFSEYVGYAGDDPAGRDLCELLAASITREDGQGPYDCTAYPGGFYGQSYAWLYWEHGVQAYLIETATEFFPNNHTRIANIIENNVNGIMTVLERVHGSSIRGNVTDSYSGEPLVANIEIEGETVLNRPRISEPEHGRFMRLVMPGTYTLNVTKEGYEDYTLTDIVVEEGSPTILEVPLVSSITGVGDGSTGDAPPGPRAFSVLQNYPNPFNPQTTIRFTVPEAADKATVNVSIYDLRGRLVRVLLDEARTSGAHLITWDGTGERGEYVESGVYLYCVQSGHFRSQRKMILAR